MGSKAHLRNGESIERKLYRKNGKDGSAGFQASSAAEESALADATCGSNAARSRAASLGSSSRHWPRRRYDGNWMCPKRTRIRRLTVTPMDSNIRLTSRLRPSRSPTWYQRFDPPPPPEEMLSDLAGPSSSAIP